MLPLHLYKRVESGHFTWPRSSDDLKVAGRWIHARRPFADFTKSVGLTAAKGFIAQGAYDKIPEMLRIDNTYAYFA